MNLENLSDEKLVIETKSLLAEEKRLGVEILRHLREIELRKIALKRGFGSLFDYCVKELRLSEASAYRRIQALRLMKTVPEVEKKIADGTLQITTAAKLQTFLKRQSSKTLDFPTPHELIAKVEHLSARQVDSVLVSLAPEARSAETIRPLNSKDFELKIPITGELKEKLDRLKMHLSHQNPFLSYERLLSQMADSMLSEIEKKAYPKPAPKRSATPTLKVKKTSREVTRHIPWPLQREVRKRDQGSCSFRDPKTGRRCTSIYQLEIDHIKPYALGGGHSAENLRLLCRAHNQARP